MSSVKTILQKAICKCPPNALLVPINLLKCMSLFFCDISIHLWSHISIWWSLVRNISLPTWEKVWLHVWVLNTGSLRGHFEIPARCCLCANKLIQWNECVLWWNFHIFVVLVLHLVITLVRYKPAKLRKSMEGKII